MTDKNKEIQEKIQEADASFGAKEYDKAARLYREALAEANQNGIYGYNEYEQKRQLAKSLANWTERVTENLAEAQKQAKNGAWDTAYNSLSKFWEVMPRDEPYLDLAQLVEDGLKKARKNMGAEEILRQASAAIDKTDFEEARRLATEIPADSVYYAAAQSIKNNVDRKMSNLIEPALNDSDKEYQAGNWSNAFAALASLKKEYPQSPVWRSRWLNVAMSHGQAELNFGMENVTRREYPKALLHFANAVKAFEGVKEAYEKHQDAQDGILQAMELGALTTYARQAQEDLDGGRRAEALNILKEAQARLSALGREGREYPAVTAILNSMLRAVESELEAIREARSELSKAERSLEERDLQLAEESYKKALQSPLPDLEKRALEVGKRVKREKKLFEEAMQLGRGSVKLEAAGHYEEARRIWKNNLEAKAALERVWLDALGVSDDQDEIARLCGKILEINPENQQARITQARMEIEPQVKALLARAREPLSQSETKLEELKALQIEIDGMRQKTKSYPTLQSHLDIVLKELQRQVGGRERAAAGAQKAEDFIHRGDWQHGLNAYESAVGEPGAPQEYKERLNQLRTAWQMIRRAQAEAPVVLQRAQTDYEQCLQRKNFDAIENALSSVDVVLEQVKQALTSAQVELMPVDLEEQGRQVTDLRKRVNLARETQGAANPRKALSNLCGQVRVLGRDAVLDALEQELRDKLKEGLPQLLAQADEETRNGHLGDSQKTLLLAWEIDPNDSQIASRQARVGEYEKLRDEIVRARANAESKENSPSELLKALHAGLDALRFVQAELVGELPEKITELLSLGGDGFALGEDPNVYNQARGLINDFRKAEGTPTWVMRSAVDLAENWLRLARKIALEGVRDSAAQLGDLLGSYKAARKLVEADPFSEQALKGEAKSRERLIVQQAQSAEKRYQWAKDAFAEDDFDNALGALDEIEAKFFLPVEQEFKTLFENVDGVEEIRKKSRDLRRQIEKGREAYQTSLPIIEQARALFQAGKPTEAEAKLNELSQHVDLEPNSKAMKKVEDFRNVIMEARIETATRVMEDGLTEIESGLNVALANDFEGLRKDLDALKKQVDFKILPPTVSKKYGDTRARVEAALEKVGVSSVYRQKGEEALEQGDYEQAEKYLQKAQENAPDNVSKANIDALLNKVERQAKEGKSRRIAWVEAHSTLEKGEYGSARLSFLSASAPEWEMGVKQGLEIAAVGLLYQDIDGLLKEDNLDEAQDVLSEAQVRAGGAQNLDAVDEYVVRRQIIAEDLQKRLARLAWRLEGVKNNKIQERERLENDKAREEAFQKALREKLVQAEDLLERSEFQSAKNIASEILADDLNHIDARAIWELALAQQQYENKQIDDAIQTLENINLDQIVSVKIRNLVNKLSKKIPAANIEKRDAERKRQEAEVAAKLQKMIQEINQYQSSWELDDAEVNLNEALKLPGAPDNERLLALKNKQIGLVKKYASIKQHLDAYDVAYSAGKWAEAVTSANKAREANTEHPRVNQAVERLYATLLEESNAALAARSFGLAEILCEEAGKLRQNVETANLLNAINNARSGLIDNLKKQAWLALKVWNLEAAERFIGAIGEDAPKDGSLEKLNQRRDAILQKAKPVYEALKPAWNHLRAADYLAAREQFAAAANLAPEELNEIEVWLSYTGHIEDAKKSVKGDEFDGAIASLRSAQEGMRVDEGNLPSVFGGANYVKELRQSAITHAQRLLVIVNELSQADKAYLESKRKNNLDEAVNYLAKEDEIKESFWQSLKMPVGSETPSGNLPASVRPMPKPNADSSLATDKSAQSEHTENRESGQYSEPVTAKTHISVETFDSGAVKEGSNQDNTQKEQDGAGSLNFVESAQSDNVENCPPTSAASNSSAGTPDDEPRENTSFTWNAPPPVDYD